MRRPLMQAVRWRVTRRTRVFSVAAALCATPPTLSAQLATVRVVDSLGVPIPFAVVNGPKVSNRVADSTGMLRLAGSFSDTLRLRVQRIGYAPYEGPTVRSAEDDLYTVVLARVSTELQRVNVIATRNTPLSRSGFYDRMERVRRGAIVGTFITPEELDQRSPMQISRVLFGRQHVSVVGRGDGGRTVQTLAGRGGRCAMTILVDGIRVNGVIPPPGVKSDNGRSAGSNFGIDDLVDAGSVSGIEIYPSTANAPAELIPLTGGGSCGIVAVWTGGRR